MQVNVAGLRRNIKNLAHNYSDAQVKVREATSNDPWGPSATIMAEIADLTYNVVAFSEIMQMIWKRLNDHGKNWRHVYKALILLEYLIKTGTEKVAQQCKENIFAIQTLREFVYFEEGKDQGTHVREKAKQLVILLKDDERLKNERIKALKAKERFAQHPSGFGSDGYIDGPLHRDMPPGWQEEPVKPVSELEMVRPQTAGEEELQLQLAMAMSREEAEQEEAKRRSDDVRLQLALSQSEQDFKQKAKKEEPQSHLLDLLDISLGATSISSPPLGAAGGLNSDPWATPARAASQMSDPWSGTSSPPVDPWQPAGVRSSSAASAPLGAVGGIGLTGNTNGDAWTVRTQSPSVASGSSTEGWLPSNGINGNVHHSGATSAAATTDPWLAKTVVAHTAAVPSGSASASAATATSTSTSAAASASDPWLVEGPKVGPVTAAKSGSSDDPWAPKCVASKEDPWKSVDNAGAKKPSPDLDEFDIITNRNKTGEVSTTNNSRNNASNNNTSLIDDLDPLSATNLTNTSATLSGASKKPLKTPQAFLGENSSLVNLDNLIKPVVPQTGSNAAAYNPFSDTVVPPKPNLFQQQQPAVPSINQLKQQQPFAVTINQDPWAPVTNTTVSSQLSRDLLNCDFDELCFDTNSPKQSNPHFSNYDVFAGSNTKSACDYNTNMKYSEIDFEVFNTLPTSTAHANNNNQFCENSSQNIGTTQDMRIPREPDVLTASWSHNKSRTWSTHISSLYPHGTMANNNGLVDQYPYKFAHSSPSPSPSPSAQPQLAPLSSLTHDQNFINPNTNPAGSKYASNYSSALTASLASTPGVTIKTLNPAFTPFNSGLSYSNSDLQCTNSSNSSLMRNSEMDNNNNSNNNNMPWVKPEIATSNPFLS